MTCLHNIRYKKLYDNKVFPLGSTEKLLSSTLNDTFSNPRRYSFLLKDAMILGKMFEGEGDNKKSKEKRLFCCHYQNIYVLLQKQKTRGHHQHRIIWERALPGLRCKDKNKNGIYQRFFRKSFLDR